MNDNVSNQQNLIRGCFLLQKFTEVKQLVPAIYI